MAAIATPVPRAQPCATIAKGRSKLASGDTLYLRGGTYDQSIVVTSGNNLPSGSSWATATTIAGYPGETVTLTSSAGIDLRFHTGGPPAVVRYIIFQNFNLVGGGGLGALGCGYPVDMNCGPHFIRWQDIDISGHHFSSVGNGYGASDLQYIRIKVHDGGGPRLAGHGFYVLSPRMLLDGVEVYNYDGYGLQIYDSGCPLEGEERHCGDDSIIRNSSFHHIRGDDGAVTLNHGANIQFYNNVVYNNDHGGVSGICYGRPNNTQVYNNTFYGNGGTALSICAGVSNTLVKNNIFVNNTNNFDDRGSGTVYDHNLCGAAGPQCDIVGDPRFTNASGSDFTLQAASPARNAGVTLGVVTTDAAGTTRPQGNAYDIGVYEYVEGGGQPPSTLPPPRNLMVVTP